MNTISKLNIVTLCFTLIGASACTTPQAGPDKTVGGAVLGAAWGAGSGAVVGNQISEYARPGEGAAIGAGFGIVTGAAAGLGYDQVEDTQIEHEQQLAAVKIQNITNRQEIADIQRRLDIAANKKTSLGVYQVFFDEDETSIKSGSVANLEILAEAIKASPTMRVVNVVGHSDDSGDMEYNKKIAEARARSVSAYLTARGVSADQIRIKNYGSERPLASNATPAGRQLNRRVDVY
ncbi:MAG: OmpA family protein [Bdellovibrionota bacterium]|jgi:outer membrane protein OmpA-like peptidoglycan-associated protein